MFKLKATLKYLPIFTVLFLTSCLESEKPLIDDKDMIDPFGRDFKMTYSYADLPIIPSDKWFHSMTRNGQPFRVAFVTPVFMQETSVFSYSIAMYELTEPTRYNYELLRFTKNERSVYRCQTIKANIDSKKSLYEAVEVEYNDLIKNGISYTNCGVPVFVRDDKATNIRQPIPELPMSLEDKQQQVSQMIDIAKFGRQRDKSNTAYDFLTRDGTLVECMGPFYGRINYRRKSDTNGKPMTLLISYLGNPASIGSHQIDFKECAVALRKVEYIMLQDAAVSMGLTFVPKEMDPAHLIGVNQNFLVFYDSQK